MLPFDPYEEANKELYAWWLKSHPQWWLKVSTLNLIGVPLIRENLPEHFPRHGMEPHEWDNLWFILAARLSSQDFEV